LEHSVLKYNQSIHQIRELSTEARRNRIWSQPGKVVGRWKAVKTCEDKIARDNGRDVLTTQKIASPPSIARFIPLVAGFSEGCH
jgi:hypothetical protein